MTAQVIPTNMAIVAAGEIPALVGSLNVNSRLVSECMEGFVYPPSKLIIPLKLWCFIHSKRNKEVTKT